ncbi:hypothetical protein D3C77_729020 [compost metagenome]
MLKRQALLVGAVLVVQAHAPVGGILGELFAPGGGGRRRVHRGVDPLRAWNHIRQEAARLQMLMRIIINLGGS